MDQFVHTTDSWFYWLQKFAPEALSENSPHHIVDRMVTPMLVIHGDWEYRVPIGRVSACGRRSPRPSTARACTDSCSTPTRSNGC